ncbi:MAG: hypothetical protein K6C12_15510 [Oscillospiraceae bacterium]|nr:hypothetical protein [Oscillospiraceae bacterium]
MKKALPKGILIGLAIALALILSRTLLGDASFLENLTSLYGILTIICFPIAFVAIIYSSIKKKEDKQ